MDIVVLVEGSSAMNATFGNHTSGYARLVNMLADWAPMASLAGDQARAGDNSSLYPAGTTRFAFVQFSGTAPGSDSMKTPGEPALSGYFPELR
ncbi:hypothetical protein DIPPA_08760 [Diplonema papillatum]|nr:hypothetical protein DIPPA_08760 [Diplonema papillatum]